MATTDQREIEIKLRLSDPEHARRSIEQAGFRISRPRVFEANSVFDTPHQRLRSQRSLLRLREAGGRNTLTFKGPPEPGKHKSREEIETTVSDAPAARQILERIGFECAFRYEKYRTEYQRADEPGTVTLDETPIGWFLELEGEPAWIDRTAGALGYSERDYLTDSYYSLYEADCRNRGVVPGHMVFSG